MRKYTKEILAKVAVKCTSVTGIMKSLGVNVASGGTHNHITKLLKEFEIDVSHFVSHPKHKGYNKKPAQSILTLRTDGARARAVVLRRALLESGRKYECECCGQGPIWNNKELRLQVDHKNGKRIDDRLENLRFICPNCHTQTPNYCNNKGKTGLCSWPKKLKKS